MKFRGFGVYRLYRVWVIGAWSLGLIVHSDRGQGTAAVVIVSRTRKNPGRFQRSGGTLSIQVRALQGIL